MGASRARLPISRPGARLAPLGERKKWQDEKTPLRPNTHYNCRRRLSDNQAGCAAPLEVGAMAMIGKHQLCVVAAPSACAGPRGAGLQAGPLQPTLPPRGGAESKCGDDALEEEALALECFAPDGSPLQGRVFKVGAAAGATLGRRATNAVTFTAEVGGEPMGVDTSVSAEHARIVYSHDRHLFELRDGNANGRPSTNGTWIRLSGLHAKSAPVELQSGDELLVGTIRFECVLQRTVVERELDDD